MPCKIRLGILSYTQSSNSFLIVVVHRKIMTGHLKSIEPPTFHGKVNTVDNWVFSVELYFKAAEIKYETTDKEKACAIACALFRDIAL